MQTTLFNRFTNFLSMREPSLIGYAVDLGKMIKDDLKISSDLDTFRIEVGISEIVVIFGFFHEHFLSPDEPEEDAFLEVVDLCRGIISEDMVAFYVYDSNNKLIESILDTPESQPAIPAGGKIIVKSYKGFFNRG